MTKNVTIKSGRDGSISIKARGAGVDLRKVVPQILRPAKKPK